MSGLTKPRELIAVAGIILAVMGAFFMALSLILTFAALAGADVDLARAVIALSASAGVGVIGIVVAAVASAMRGGR